MACEASFCMLSKPEKGKRPNMNMQNQKEPESKRKLPRKKQ